MISDEIKNWVLSKIEEIWKGVIHKVGNVIFAPLNWFKYALHTLYSSVQSLISSIPEPLRLIVLVFVAGASLGGVLWLLKRIYDLL